MASDHHASLSPSQLPMWGRPTSDATEKLRPSQLLHELTSKNAKGTKGSVPHIIEFMNLEDHTSQSATSVPVGRPLFEPSPAAILFDEYIPFNTHFARLALRNNDTVARRIKLEPPDSPFFKIKKLHGIERDGKVAAGIEVAYQIEFLPQERREYALDLICVTEREKFVVPVRARGTFAALSFPDEVDFGLCPVKIKCSKVMTVHNVGTRGAKFVMTASPPFTVTPQTVYLDIGAAIQVEMEFHPKHTKEREGELAIQDDTGRASYVRLLGDVTNLEVYLSHPMVEPAPAYLTLSSRKRIKVCNGSDYPVEFSWKAYAGEKSEEAERSRLLDELRRMEAAEVDELGACSDDERVDAMGILHRKYKNLRKAVLDDPMNFVDECFSLDPPSGKIWAHSDAEITVTFVPQLAATYAGTAFLDISGRDTRLPLQIRGRGIGPQACILYDDLFDFGDVFINDAQTHDFSIQNRGEIPAEFSLVPTPLPPGVDISFAPAAGVLGIGETSKVFLTFKSAVLGEISITFNFKLKGSDELLRVRFKAHVIPPMFHFDVDTIDFGTVSYAFRQTKVVKLVNTSRIAMTYELRIPQDGLYKHQEFVLSPTSGSLPPFGSQDIHIAFTSVNVKKYEYYLVVSVHGVGSDLLNIPVLAQCFVPEVHVLKAELVYGDCYLRYAHMQTLHLINTNPHLPAKYEIVAQDDHSKVVAIFSGDLPAGDIPANSTLAIEVALVCEKLGSIRLPLYVRIAGSIDLPLSVTIVAVGRGPSVVLDAEELAWGPVTCLVDHIKSLRLTNTSLIPAPFKTFIRNARSKFSVDQKEYTLAPGETIVMTVVANLDDTIVFKEQLHILVTEGHNILIPLSAKGTGTTMWSPSDMKLIDFSFQMTNRQCEWSCTLENKGKRGQVLAWVNKTIRQQQLELLQKAKTLQKTTAKANVKGLDLGDDLTPIFSVFPASIELKPRTACTFYFRGFSTTPGLMREELICETRIGQEKNAKVAFATEIVANFINPRIEASAPGGLVFSYIYAQGVEMETQSQPLTLTNACELPLSFVLRTQVPFSVDTWEAVLQPKEKMELNVEFYPGYKDDHLSRVINGKLVTSYTGHPQKDSLDLRGEIGFPNLEFEFSRIDFGCILNDTQKSMLVKVTNVSKVETQFHWVFIEDEKEARAVATTKRPYIPVNQVFDILPIRGCLQPGEVETVEFIFYGHANRKFKSLVACEVTGGPEYELTLAGEASSVTYRLDRPYLDFGPVIYNKAEDREFAIMNLGKVAFSFVVSLEKVSRSGVVEVSPMAGRIFANDKQRVSVRFKPGIPDTLVESIWLEIAHFPPIEFKLYCRGIFASLSVNLPRGKSHPNCAIENVQPKWRDVLKGAKYNIEHPRLAALPPTTAITCEPATLGLARPNSRAPVAQPRLNKDGVPMTAVSTERTARTTARTTTRNAGVPTNSTARSQKSPLKNSASGDSFDLVARGQHYDSVDVDTEACRMLFVKYLLTTLRDEPPTESPRDDGVGSGGTGGSGGNNHEPVTVPKLIIRSAGPPDAKSMYTKGFAKGQADPEGDGSESPTKAIQGYLLAQYILDFGNVVTGTHRVKKFVITNTGQIPTSFQLDKNLALGRGFAIDPERVVRLPEKKGVEFNVTFTARKNGRHGAHGVNLLLDVKNGPPSLLTFKANVTVPDLVLLAENIDFGKVVVGRSHVVHSQLYNNSPVVVEWSLKKPMGSARDVSYFRMEPMGGLLHPGTRCNLKVEFMPLEGRLYHVKVPVKISSNPKTRAISCQGEGTELRVAFDPPMAELGPVLPFATPVERTVVMRNESDHPVEVYSLDFDAQYRDEEEILRDASGYGDDDYLRLPLRLPGQGLPEIVLQEYRDRQSAETGATDATASPAEEPADDEVEARSLRARDKAVDYIFLGPPLAGKTTQAKLMGEKENLVVWTFDEAVALAAVDESELGKRVRKCLDLPPLAWDLPKAPMPEEPPPDHDKKSKKDPKKGKIEVEEVKEEPVVVAPPPEPTPREVMGVELLEWVLHWRLAQPDMANGSILDGWGSTHVAYGPELLHMVAAVLGGATVILLSMNEDMYEAHLLASIKYVDEEMDRLERSLEVPAVPEEPAEPADEAVEAPEEKEEPKLRSASVSRGRLRSNVAEIPAPVVVDVPVVVEEPPVVVDPVAVQVALESCANLTHRLHELLDLEHYDRYCQELAQQKKEWDAVLFRLPPPPAMPPAEVASEPETSVLSARSLPLDQASVEEPVMDEDAGLPSMAQDYPEPAADEPPAEPLLLSTVAPKPRRLLALHEVNVNEVGPPLQLHGLVFASIEKYLRELASSKLVIPPPVTHQLVKRPYFRGSRRPVTRFSLSPANVVRWILPPQSEVRFQVTFASGDTGTFDSTLGFEILGSKREVSLFCRGICAVPGINADPRNVFMSRAKHRADGALVHKKYVLSKGVYEFGPLLLGKSPDVRLEPPTSEAYKAARRTNAEVFRISNPSRFPAHLHFVFEKQVPTEDPETPEKPTFAVEPTEVVVAEGDTVEVLVWAFPAKKGVLTDTLVCCIADNPEPVTFPITCIGCAPAVHLSGPWPDEAKLLDFDRLLLRRQEEKTWSVTNTCELPVVWRIVLDTPPEFEVVPREGTLKPGQAQAVVVHFTAATEGTFALTLPVDFADVEGGLVVGNPHMRKDAVKVKAEAYKIDVCSFDEEGDPGAESPNGVLDFGLLRVGDTPTKAFSLRNRGKYDIKAVLSVKRSKEWFKIAPVEVTIPPGKSQRIEVSFQSGLSGEIVLRDCKDIKCVILEQTTGEVFNEFPVSLHARAVYSKFRLQPARGLSFGSLRFNEEKKVKRLELRNDGEFAFKFKFHTAADDAVDETKPLVLGQFSIAPSAGTLDPGRLVAFDVGFQPQGAAVFRENVRLDVSGRDPHNENETALLQYELTGESCYPGINTTDMEGIFEEQAVVQTFGSGHSHCIDRNQPMFAEAERLFDFGAVVVAKSVVERFKISNPTKVLASVHFAIKAPTDKDDAGASTFMVQPAVWDIPPHEHRYVNVHFKPTSIAMSHALFTATVDDGADPTTNLLQFDMRGEGTMPCVTIEKPTAREANVLTLAFGRQRVGKGRELPLVLRNDGIVPATVLFSMPSSTNFTLLEGAATSGLVLLPKKTHATAVLFKPVKAHDDPCTVLLKLSVQYNPFEDTLIKLTGQGYKELVTFDGLVDDDQLHFPDVDLATNAAAATVRLGLRNQSAHVVRFAWASHPLLHFVPATGHLYPQATLGITATFAPPGTPAVLEKEKVQVALTRIKPAVEMPWDDSLSTLSFESPADPTASTASEPPFEVLEPPLPPLTAHVFAVADTLRYSCKTMAIAFKKTFMFQACTTKFVLRNESKVRLEFAWAWCLDVLALPDVTTTSMDTPCPFAIEPEAGEIGPDDSQEFVVRFAPIEVADYVYKLEGHLKNGDALSIAVRGSSLRPVCHVDLEPSDYAQRRSLSMVGPAGELGPLDASVRVVEMESLGVRVRNTRRFYVINPTNVSYEFAWVPEGRVSPAFRCATPKGLMLSGKRCEMVFEFTPTQMELEEMFWRLKIDHFHVDQLFLFVGTTTEPRVLFDRGSVNFATLLLGSKAAQTIYLTNQEHLPFNFAFEKVHFVGERPVISLAPLSGVVPPHGRTAIEVEFAPNEEKLYNFNVACTVKRKPTRLSLNVKGEGYAIHDHLVVTDDTAAITMDAIEPSSSTLIDFGTVRVHDKARRSIVLSNAGKFNFEFTFNWQSAKHPMLTLEPANGTVRKNDKVVCHLTFAPTKETALEGQHIVCTTAGSRDYAFPIHGNAVPPAVDFSFTSHDFGPCFIAEPDAAPMVETIVLRITNMDHEMDISVDCSYEKRPFLHVTVQPTVLGPHEALDVPVTFTARHEGPYREIVPFSINGTTTVNVELSGEGIFPKIDLATATSVVHFGTLQIGQSVSRVVKLVNRAKRKTPLSLLASHMHDIGLTLFPQTGILIRPRETIDVELRFAPPRRVTPFEEELYVDVCGTKRKLLTLTGACQGMDVQFETETLSFGPVVYGSQLVRRLLLQNRGDLVAKFQWDLKRLGPDFAIAPSEGVVLPNQDKQFEVTFRPVKINDDIRLEKVLCTIDGSDFLTVTFTGACVAQLESSIKELVFESRVRKESFKEITIENKTSAPWNLVPMVSGDHWRCAEHIAVPANGKATVPVYYTPLAMTQCGDTFDRPKQHQGSLFLALPDGSAITYHLVGTAAEPEALGALTFTTPAKASLPIKLPLPNWLKKAAQVFHVVTENVTKCASTFVQGADTITVPPNATREYGLKVFAYLEGPNEFKVTFTNAETGEYVFYTVLIDVTPPVVVETLVFHAPVRQSVKKLITVENPFPPSTLIQFDDKAFWSCSAPSVRVRRVGDMTGRTEGAFEVEYRPLLHTTEPTEASLVLRSPQLGEYPYTLRLSTSPAGIEKILYFTVPLGGSQTQAFRFHTFASKPTDFKCTVAQPTFFNVAPVLKTDVTGWDGTEQTVTIKFEPEALGDIRDTLLVASDAGGEYKCTLQGQSIPPVPQGPFVFATTQDIEFKNVFNAPREFTFAVDNPGFTVNASTTTIGAKAAKVVTVKNVDTSSRQTPLTGKLLVTCPSLPDLPPWVFYLEGEAKG
ncbi:hydrocephalus-inducing protein [Achlya hypogyna]|uniref:Hydrocephalus-inducing protein n=1 Tax=Achlya hypogyna TaxID=1202772 RepID=A0A1V9Z071_ACHHY|nr:hydrocephalus-inducing protein [Achlya hypogyna]